MTALQKLQTRSIEIRARLAELADPDAELTDESRTELRSLRNELRDVEERRSALTLAEEHETREEQTTETPDAEEHERMQLRSKASLTKYFKGITRGRLLDGAEGELREAVGCEPNEIPFEMWEGETQERAITPAPSTVGVNLQPIRPAVFAPSIAPKLGIDMPNVPSGTYAEGVISTSQTATARTKSTAVAATAGAITVETTTPYRVATRLELTLEDIAAIGQANFESMFRQNASLALSAELDDIAINGEAVDGSVTPAITGLFGELTDASAPAAGVADFDKFLETVVAGIDGLWATTMNQLNVVVNPEAFRLAERSFRDISAADLGDISFGAFAAAKLGAWWTNSRMPDKASHIAKAILYRSGRMLEGGSRSMRTAVCPVWSRGVAVDDIYSGSAKGERYYTVSVLIGDVIVVQSGAYSELAFRVSS